MMNHFTIIALLLVAITVTELHSQDLEIIEYRKLKKYRTLNVKDKKVLKVEYLDLSNSNLDSVSCDIRKFTNLKVLILKGNRIKDIPLCLESLDDLEFLDLSSNGMDSLPHQVSNLYSLKYLLIHNNRIDKIDSSISKLRKLKTLMACFNLFMENDKAKLEELLPGCRVAIYCN